MPVRYPRVLIVDAPSTTRGVVYDFNDDTQSLDTGSKTDLSAAEWSFGQLDLQGEPDSVGVEWSLQRITFQQTITGTKAAAMARQVAMSQALLRRRYWLEFQLTASTTPVWWRAYRTAPGEVSLEQVYVNGALSDRWVISGGIDVKAFSFASRITNAAKTIGNDPTNDATAPSTGYVLPTVKGDSPSRLRLAFSAGNGAASRWLVASIATNRTNPVVRVPIGTGDPFVSNMATGSETEALDGSMRSNTVDPGVTLYLQGRVPSASGTMPRGRYLVLLRVRATAGTTVAFQLLDPNRPSTSNTLASTTSATFPTAAYQWVPLGVIGVGDLPDGVPATDPTGRYIRLNVLPATAGTNTLAVDGFMFVPISGQDIVSSSALILDVDTFTKATGDVLTCDGDAEFSWVATDLADSMQIAASGGYPTVDPTVANTLLVLPMRNDGTTTTSAARKAATVAVTASYHPRWTYLGDGA